MIRSTCAARSLALCCAVLAACSQGPAAPSPGGQVVARVDGRELTVTQLEHLLRTARPGTDDLAARRLALDALIDQHLLAERARRDGLDRDANVLAQLQAADLRIRAQAALERFAAAAGAPSAAEIDAYYADHPALFERRRIYTVDEIALAPGAVDAQSVRDRSAAARRLDEVADWLRSRQVAFGRRAGTLRAEDAGEDGAAALLAASEGGIVALQRHDGMQVLQLKRIESAPVPREQATRWIERRLGEVRRREAVDRGVAALRGSADIALVGEFAGTSPAPARPAPRNAPASRGSPPEPAGHLDRGVGALR